MSSEEVEVDSDTAHSSKRRKEVAPRSVVWKHFTKYTDERGVKKARCNYCSKPYKADPKTCGTGSMKSHMHTYKSNPHNHDLSQTKIYGYQQSGGSETGGIMGTWRFDREAARKALGEVLITDELPFSFVEWSGFKRFVSIALPPNFLLPSKTINKDCYDLYLQEKAKLKILLKDPKRRVCLTIDTWSSLQRINYMFGEEEMLDNTANPYLSKTTRLPRKRFYRARAHSNPLSDSHFPVPISPSQFDYSLHFPQLFPSSDQQDAYSKKIQFADIGCGFGGLLISLSTLFPETLMIGMELRDKVSEYVKERILALRVANPCQYHNISVVRTNSMKYIPNYFEKGQLLKMFFLFPDPHFKEKNHRRRVISSLLLDEYAYALGVGGIIYTITDVEELGEWMKACLEAHPVFEALTKEELEVDPVIKLLSCATEEGQKVARNGGQTFQAVYRRIGTNNV